MRPDPHDSRTEGSSGRIIYLGEVRRKRASRGNQQPDRHYLAALGLVAFVSWAVWVTVILTLQPARLLTYLAFFAPLATGLASTGAIVAYAIEWRSGRFPGLRAPLRRGALVSAVLVANLGVQAGHRWSLLVLGVSILFAMAGEAFAARRES